MSKVRLRETLAGIGNDGEIVDIPDHDLGWYIGRGFAESIAETEVEQREIAVSRQAATRARRGRKAKS